MNINAISNSRLRFGDSLRPEPGPTKLKPTGTFGADRLDLTEPSGADQQAPAAQQPTIGQSGDSLGPAPGPTKLKPTGSF